MRTAVVNPVLRRELLERWRGNRTFWVLTAYVSVLALLMQLLWWLANNRIEEQARFGGFSDFTITPQLGRYLFDNLIGFVLLLVLFIAPGYAAAQIAGERERRTLGLLQVTMVRPSSIALGKLGASVAWLLLLILAALPFGAATFFLGGVTVADLVRSVFSIVVLAVAIAAIALGISSVARKTSGAVIATYGLILFLVLGTGFAHILETSLRELNFRGDTPIALHFNPFYGVADAARSSSNIYIGGELPSIMGPFASQLPGGSGFEGGGVGFAFEEAAIARLDVPFGGDFDPGVFLDQALSQPIVQIGGSRTGTWWRVLLVYTFLGLLGFLVAAYRLRPDRVPPRYRRRVKDGGGETTIEPLPPIVDPAPGGDT